MLPGSGGGGDRRRRDFLVGGISCAHNQMKMVCGQGSTNLYVGISFICLAATLHGMYYGAPSTAQEVS